MLGSESLTRAEISSEGTHDLIILNLVRNKINH